MRRDRLLIGLFLLATLLVDLVVRSLPVKVPGESNSQIVLLALYFSQVSLVAIWLGLGRTPAHTRIATAFLVLVAWSYPSILSSSLQMRLYVDFSADLAATVAIPLLVARLFGLQLTRLGFPAAATSASSGLRRWQFSIRYLFGLMTALAVILGVLQWKAPYVLVPSTYAFFIDGSIASLAAGRALIAWAALWAALGIRATMLRMAVLAIAALGAYGLTPTPLSFYHSSDWSGLPQNGFPIFLEAALLLASLWVCRLAGYRIESPWCGTNPDRTVDDFVPRSGPAATISLVCPHCCRHSRFQRSMAGRPAGATIVTEQCRCLHGH